MIFHENRLLADNSHVISYLIFVEKLGKMSQTLSSAAVKGLNLFHLSANMVVYNFWFSEYNGIFVSAVLH